MSDPRQSLTILLSHAHLDHVVGLTFLLDALAVTQLERVLLIGEEEKLDAVRRHLYDPLLFPVEPSMEFQSLPDRSGEMSINGANVSWFPLEHPGGSIGFRIEHDDRRLSYVTDTVARPDADYLSIIEDSDLLLHECYFNDDLSEFAQETGHSWLSAVEDVVERTRARRTALIHINPLAEILGNEPELTEHQQELGMFLAEDEMVIDY